MSAESEIDDICEAYVFRSCGPAPIIQMPSLPWDVWLEQFRGVAKYFGALEFPREHQLDAVKTYYTAGFKPMNALLTINLHAKLKT